MELLKVESPAVYKNLIVKLGDKPSDKTHDGRSYPGRVHDLRINGDRYAWPLVYSGGAGGGEGLLFLRAPSGKQIFRATSP